jgi:hypothetical protein
VIDFEMAYPRRNPKTTSNTPKFKRELYIAITMHCSIAIQTAFLVTAECSTFSKKWIEPVGSVIVGHLKDT